MRSALRCRVDKGEGFCGTPAAVGLVTELVLDADEPVLELTPLCPDHAPEFTHEAATSMNVNEWALVSLAYGTADGGLT